MLNKDESDTTWQLDDLRIEHNRYIHSNPAKYISSVEIRKGDKKDTIKVEIDDATAEEIIKLCIPDLLSCLREFAQNADHDLVDIAYGKYK